MLLQQGKEGRGTSMAALLDAAGAYDWAEQVAAARPKGFCALPVCRLVKHCVPRFCRWQCRHLVTPAFTYSVWHTQLCLQGLHGGPLPLDSVVTVTLLDGAGLDAVSVPWLGLLGCAWALSSCLRDSHESLC